MDIKFVCSIDTADVYVTKPNVAVYLHVLLLGNAWRVALMDMSGFFIDALSGFKRPSVHFNVTICKVNLKTQTVEMMLSNNLLLFEHD